MLSHIDLTSAQWMKLLWYLDSFSSYFLQSVLHEQVYWHRVWQLFYGLTKKTAKKTNKKKKPKHYFHKNLKNAKNDTLWINLRLLQFWDNQCHLLIITRTRWRSVAIVLVHHWCKWDKCVILKEMFLIPSKLILMKIKL